MEYEDFFEKGPNQKVERFLMRLCSEGVLRDIELEGKRYSAQDIAVHVALRSKQGFRFYEFACALHGIVHRKED